MKREKGDWKKGTGLNFPLGNSCLSPIFHLPQTHQRFTGTNITRSADGSPLKINTDFFGKKRSKSQPTPGPFEKPGTGPLTLKVW